MKIVLKTKKTFDETKYEIRTLFVEDIKTRIKFNSLRDEKGNRKEGFVRVGVHPNNIFDNCEWILMDTLMKNEGEFTIDKVEKFSKSFIDLHNIEKRETENFNKSLKLINEKKKPINVKKSEKLWWVGINEFMPKNISEFEDIRRDIYVIGNGLGLVCRDLTTNL